MNTTGQLIKSWRVSKGLTQRELAALCGVSSQTIWYWESGTKRPTNAHCDLLQAVSKGKLRRDVLAFS